MRRQQLVARVIVATFTALLSTPLFASAAEPDTVRVGIFDYQAFYGTDSENKAYGYGYEYLDTLAKYAGFRYEYVQGSWTECLAWLESGKIDMLDSAQQTKERQQDFLFSQYSTGTSYGELYVRADNTSIAYNEFAAMDGMKVGMLQQNSRNETFLQYAKSNGFAVQTTMFRTAAELSEALQNGTVDAIVSSNLRQGANERAIMRFAPTPFYLMFQKDDVALKAKVDAALENILIDMPDFNAALNDKYYSRQHTVPEFTKEERVFIENAPVIQVTYNETWMPFLTRDAKTGELSGINADILNLLGQKTGLTFSYVHDPVGGAEASVLEGEADFVLGYEPEETGTGKPRLFASDPFLSMSFCLVGGSGAVGTEPIIAVPQNCIGLVDFLDNQFPGSSIVVLTSIADCYNELSAGQVDFVMDNIYSASHVIGNNAEQGLMIAAITPASDHYTLGFSPTVDPTLVRILNKGIAALSEEEKTEIYTAYTVHKETINSITEVLYRYRLPLAVSSVVLVTVLLILVPVVYLRRRKRQRQLWKTAYIDSMTGIGNMNLFEEEMRELLDKNANTRYAVCKFDLQNFKLINEIYGFECGDWVIKLLAKRLKAICVPGLDTCARLSGDDFIILKSYVHPEENAILLDENEQFVSEAVRRQFDCVIQFKVGAYYIENNTESVSSIVEKANYAHSICKSKQNGGKFVYDETVKQSAIEEKKVEARMEEALAQRQFMLYLQPKYHLADESLAGAEALVRWRSEESGQIIFPNSFIPLFERNGFITKLDMYMLERVCELIRSWIDSGKTPTTISINFSRLHLRNPDFTKEICHIVDHHQVPRHYIEIELTESTMFDNEEAMFAVLESLHEEGFTLSMDDFGTGYSSLGLLKNLPVDVIKIDRSFFIDSRFKTRARAVIENVMQMAKRLDIHTVAEGVESQEQIDMLRELGCEIVQGYYYSKPVPESEFRLEGAKKTVSVQPQELRLEPQEIGNLSEGRAEMGETMPVYMHRMFELAMRKALVNMYGEGEMMFAMRSAGKLAGSLYARQYLNMSLPFDDLLLHLAEQMADMKIGKLTVEQLDLETGGGVLTIENDLDCSGSGLCGETLCQYDEGFIAGILKEYTKKSYHVVETDCWGTGAALCRFEIKLR